MLTFNVSFFDVPYSLIKNSAVKINLREDGTVSEGLGEKNPLYVVGAPMLVVLKVLALGRRDSDAVDLGRLLDVHYGGSSMQFMQREGELVEKSLRNNSVKDLMTFKRSLENFARLHRE